MTFGEFVKNLRIKQNLSLREFCLKVDFDPSNWSKIERGKMSPPKEENKLINFALHLGLKKDSLEWKTFYDLAYIAHQQIPTDIMNDKELVKILPVFFRTIRGEKPTDEKLLQLAETIRNS